MSVSGSVYEVFTISQLIDQCIERGLSDKYRVKRDLVDRLIENDLLNESDLNGISINSDDVFVLARDNTITNGNLDNSSNSADNSDKRETGNEGNDLKHTTDNEGRIENAMSSITFKDVEETQEKFSGLPEDDCRKWFISFEELATDCKWTDMQNFYYAKMLLKGVALKNLRRKNNITNYVDLKKFLKDEYPSKASVMYILRHLAQRKKQARRHVLSTCLICLR